MDGQNFYIGTVVHNDKPSKTLQILSAEKFGKNPIEYEEENKDDPSIRTISYKNVTKSFENTLRSKLEFMDSVRLKYASKEKILKELEGIDKSTLREPRVKKTTKKGAKGGGGGRNKRADIIKQLQESPCYQCSEFEAHLLQANSQSKNQKEMGKLVRNFKDEGLIKNTEFKNKIRVLKELGFITKDDVLDVKGTCC